MLPKCWSVRRLVVRKVKLLCSFRSTCLKQSLEILFCCDVVYEEEDMIERGNSLSKLFYYGEKVQAWAGGERRERGGGEGSNMGGGEGAPYQKTQN